MNRKYTRSQKFLFNTITTAILQFFTFITGMIIPKIILNNYGSEINGVVTSISQLVAYISLVEAGISASAIYKLYKPLAENDKDFINKILVSAKNFYFKSGFLFVGLITLLAVLYPLFIHVNTLNYFEMFFLFFIIGSNGVMEFFTLAKYRALLTADQKTYIISIATIIQIIINTIIIYILANLGVSIVIVRLIAISSIFIRTLILWIYAKYRYKFLDFSKNDEKISLEKRWDALYMQILGIIQRGSPIIIATIILTIYDVSIYSIYYLVIQGINSLMSIFTSGLSAGFGELIVKNEKNKFKKSFLEFEYIYLIFLTIIYSITFVLYLPFVKLYTIGADINYIYPSLVYFIVINGYFFNIKTPNGMLIIARGLYRETKIQTTIQGLIAIGLGFFLGYFYGLDGIILGSLISNVYRTVDLIIFAPKNLTGFKVTKSIFRIFRSIIIFSIIIIVYTFYPIRADSLKEWILQAIFNGSIILLAVVIVNFTTDKKIFIDSMYRVKRIFGGI